jgi:hypothetical protein
MLAFSEMIKSFTPVKRIFSKNASFRKRLPEKIFDLLAIIFSIYLALNIEGWAEKRNEHKRLKQYYGNMIEEIAKDTVTLTDVIHDAERHIKNEKEHLQLLRRYQPAKQDSVTEMYQGMLSTVVFGTSKMVSYKSMVVSGEIKLIEDLKIRSALIELADEYEGMKLWDDLYFDYFRNELMGNIFRSFDMLTGDLIDKQYYTSPAYRNIIYKSLSFNNSRLLEYRKALKIARKTRELLMSELNK